MFEQVRDVIVDTLSCDLESVTMDARLVEDLEPTPWTPWS